MSRVHKRGSKLVNFEGYLQIKLQMKDFKNHFFLLLGLVLNDFYHKIQCAIFFVITLKFSQCDGKCHKVVSDLIEFFYGFISLKNNQTFTYRKLSELS